METTFEVPQGSFELARDDVSNGSLRAWDAADGYLLNQLAESETPADGRVLLVNDAFGALAVALASDAREIVSWSDSFIAHRVLAKNLTDNGIASDRVTRLKSSEDPRGKFDLVLVKIPKHNSLLEDQLCRIKPLLTDSTTVIAGGMARHIHTSTLDLFQRIIGPTRTSLAHKKARLAFVEVDNLLSPPVNPWPATWTHNNIEVTNRAGVFSARKLDIGTRFFLDHLPTLSSGASTIDLGCGNGIVGASLLRRNPNATCTFVDESFGAVASAEATVLGMGPDAYHRSQFVVADGANSEAIASPNSVDIVLNNPPFHSNAALSASISETMFRSSYEVLKTNGELRVVGNRHLGYHVRLRKIFGNCDVLASNSKFVVLRAAR